MLERDLHTFRSRVIIGFYMTSLFRLEVKMHKVMCFSETYSQLYERVVYTFSTLQVVHLCVNVRSLYVPLRISCENMDGDFQAPASVR